MRDLHVFFRSETGRELHAVAGVSFDIARGEVFGLVGESGCGKTTTVLSLMGLLPSSATVWGEVRIEGRDILAGGERAVRAHRWRDVAMVFQGAMNCFSPVKTIGWQIVEPMKLHGIASGRQARKRVAELLEMVGITASAAERYPHEFSGGMRQRAAIAMALSCEPKILLADEPTTGLDVMVQAQILELLTGLSKDLGLTVVLVTHDLPVVAQMCSRAAVMYAGQVAEIGPVDALYHEPHHPYTRLLFGAIPDLFGEGDVTSIPGVPPRLDRPLAGCPFRARCDSAFERCITDCPRLMTVGPAHEAACHLNDPSALAGAGHLAGETLPRKPADPSRPEVTRRAAEATGGQP
ncbi:MAG: ABC transporter ATP-binding protein [Acidimicrobiales bacterium]